MANFDSIPRVMLKENPGHKNKCEMAKAFTQLFDGVIDSHPEFYGWNHRRKNVFSSQEKGKRS